MNCRLAWILLVAIAVPSAAGAQARWSVNPRPAVTIHGTTAGGDVLFGNPTGVARLSTGEIAVADGSPSAPMIVFFDGEGHKLRAVGRTGAGPGEYRTISWMRQCAPDTLYAYDLWLQRIEVLDRDGSFVREFRTPIDANLADCSPSGQVAIVGDFARDTPPSPTLRSATGPLLLTDARGSVLHSVAEVPVYDLAFTTVAGRMVRLASPFPSVALAGERVYVGPSDSSSILVFALDGRRMASIPVRVARRAPEPRHLDAAADLMVSFAPPGTLRDRMRERYRSTPAAERLPPFSTLFVDPDGVLWANLSVPGDTDTVLRAFGTTGAVLGELRLPLALRVFEIGRDYVLGGYEDDDGEPVVALYRLHHGS
jgi:hypothetical protein